MPERRPNILFIITDQQYAGAMSCAGNPDVYTPNMDSLAETGVRFTRAYCTHPLCGPQRASFMTGLFPHQNGAISNNTPINPEYKGRTLGNLLADAGYDCALAGKMARSRHHARRKRPRSHLRQSRRRGAAALHRIHAARPR